MLDNTEKTGDDGKVRVEEMSMYKHFFNLKNHFKF